MLEGWIVEPPREVKAAAVRLQESLRRFDWIDLVPEHFLHVWLGVPERLGDAPQRWAEVAPFEIVTRARTASTTRSSSRSRSLCAGLLPERRTTYRSSFRT
jgi:hypothetical protein